MQLEQRLVPKVQLEQRLVRKVLLLALDAWPKKGVQGRETDDGARASTGPCPGVERVDFVNVRHDGQEGRIGGRLRGGEGDGGTRGREEKQGEKS